MLYSGLGGGTDSLFLSTECVELNQRSFFVIVGDRGKDSIVTLHYLLSKQRVSARPNVLWCYKNDLSFSSHRKKRANQIKKEIARGIREVDQDDPFDLFVSSTNIRYAYYKETDKILGNTYGMCILQDFEALTPNLLARTIETVEGGGIVVLLLKTMTSLKQLYSLSMDVHARYRTEAAQDTVARFNERFLLSLGGCDTCLVLDDELNVLPLSSGKNVKPVSKIEDQPLTPSQLQLVELKDSMKDTLPVGLLVNACKTLDQAQAVLSFVDAIAEKTLRSTVTLTASRGRGKSAALGLAIAGAIAYGYSNIFITSPSPENLKTLFEFILKGFDALGFQEHLDYDLLQSTGAVKSLVRINVFRDHRQTIQYISPNDSAMLTQAELVVIDEAAAIPLPIVKELLGNYLVFMASTINGYEGTGRSLSMKLVKQLREESVMKKSGQDSDTMAVGRNGKESNQQGKNGRSLRELKLDEPIRYAAGDPVESWLNKLLCLDCCNPMMNSSKTPFASTGCPHPSQCDLYYVTRDTLFSYHPVSEAFLQKMMSLYVASHYKNTPNDLQLLSDAPAHHLFVLLPPTDPNTNTLPEPLCVIQVCMEGQISKGTALASLSRGIRQNGDLIPWVLTQQFQEDGFAELSGARIVRVATHPEYNGMGYGSRAVSLLQDYYNGKMIGMDEKKYVSSEMKRVNDEQVENGLMSEVIEVRDVSTMPPLLLRLSERECVEKLDWIGVSYGITGPLYKFWKRAGFVPLYLRQTANEITGEHTCIMIKELNRHEKEGGDGQEETDRWITLFTNDFRKRLLELLSFQFKSFDPKLVLSLLEPGVGFGASKKGSGGVLVSNADHVSVYFSPFDLKRLESYAQNLLDYHVIIDLVPVLAKLYFLEALRGDDEEVGEGQRNVLKLTAVQASIFIAIGLQKKTVEQVEIDLGIAVSQILALFAKAVRKCSMYLESLVEKKEKAQVEKTFATSSMKLGDGKRRSADQEWEATDMTLEQDLEHGGKEVMEKLKEKQKEMIDSLDLSTYAVGGEEKEWQNVQIKKDGSHIVSIANSKSSKKRRSEAVAGTADAIQSQLISGGEKGIHDPKGVLAKLKAKKRKQKSK